MFCLDGKVALITGSSRGIGAGIARTFASAGADVGINHLNEPEQAAGICEQICKLGRRAIALPADVRDKQQVQEMFQALDREFGRIDILVNNAGVCEYEDIFNTSVESWHRVLDTHLLGTFLCSQQAMERMREARRGRIIQISSVVAHQGGMRGFVHYASAKAGQLGFTKTLARTAVPFGVTVNAIAAGIIATDMLYQTHGEEGVRRLEESVPLGLGRVDDVAAAALFLASDEARYVTGAVLDINGGLYYRS